MLETPVTDTVKHVDEHGEVSKTSNELCTVILEVKQVQSLLWTQSSRNIPDLTMGQCFLIAA